MKKIYFIGINGIGMSGLAKIMKIKGYDVKGADLTKRLCYKRSLRVWESLYIIFMKLNM